MGVLGLLGQRLVNAFSLAIVLLVVCTCWTNYNKESKSVEHALVVEKACENFPELRTNEFVSEGVKLADQRTREVVVPAIVRTITETRVYKILDVHQYYMWGFCSIAVLLAMVLWYGQRSSTIAANRDTAMVMAFAQMQQQNGRTPQPQQSALPQKSSPLGDEWLRELSYDVGDPHKPISFDESRQLCE